MGGVRKGKRFKIYFKENIHQRIASNIELISASALLFFDALSDFDATLSIPGKSKRPSVMHGNVLSGFIKCL